MRASGRARRRRAFTLVEVILTILIVSVGMVAVLRALPIVLNVSRATRQGLVAQQLATDLLSEMALLPYRDPGAFATFGTEFGESRTTRAAFDDIDDYDNWNACPPQRKDGTEEPGCAEYTRAVDVDSVSVSNFNLVCIPGSTDAKRIVITVSRPGMPSVVVSTVRLKGVNREDAN